MRLEEIVTCDLENFDGVPVFKGKSVPVGILWAILSRPSRLFTKRKDR